VSGSVLRASHLDWVASLPWDPRMAAGPGGRGRGAVPYQNLAAVGNAHKSILACEQVPLPARLPCCRQRGRVPGLRCPLGLSVPPGAGDGWPSRAGVVTMGGMRPSLSRRVVPAVLAAGLVLLPAPAFAVNQVLPEPRFPEVLLAWQADPLVLALLAGSAVLYLFGVRRVAELHPRNPWRPARTRAFLAGLAGLAVALLSPVATYDGTLFSVHMVQHLLLTMVAAPLLVLGTPVSLLVRAVGRRGHRKVMRVLHSAPVRVLTHPLIAWLGFAAVMWGTHFSGIYDAALENQAVHVAEHLLYLVAAVLLWWPAVGLDPSRWRMPHPLRVGYLFLQGPVNTFLALAIYSSGRVLYPHYASGRAWGPDPLDDQHLGGAIMWVAGDLLLLVATGLALAAWMRNEDRVTARVDAELAAQRAARRAAAAAPGGPGSGPDPGSASDPGSGPEPRSGSDPRSGSGTGSRSDPGSGARQPGQQRPVVGERREPAG
jgi:cytochrome c oxidase assembly factor CtaG